MAFVRAARLLALLLALAGLGLAAVRWWDWAIALLVLAVVCFGAGAWRGVRD